MKLFVPVTLFSLAVSGTVCGAEPTFTELQRLCAEQERQIRQLEIDNQRLQSLLSERSPAVAPAQKPPASPAAAPKPEVEHPYPTYAVREGDTLGRIARQQGTSVSTLVKLNGLTEAGLIRPGQKLRLPAASQAPASSESPKIHVVKTGETFYSIARKHDLNPESLVAANPDVDPRTLRVGQKIHLASAANPSPARQSTAADSDPPAAPAPSGLVSNRPVVRSIRIEEEITFGDFAARHKMPSAKLNALNGLDLKDNTLLAKGSELYVSAQP